MTYAYNSRRQLETDSAATLGTGVDGYARAIKRTYDSEARLEKVTTYASASGTGTVRNEVQLAYNDFDQVTTSYQSHSGAVSVSTSPKVRFNYDATQVSSAYAF
jgi:hypothetical protein